MAKYWWKDLTDRNNTWQGLELIVQNQPTPHHAMEMLSGHHGRMMLQFQKETLFWATMLKDHSGAWLVFNSEHPHQRSLLPPINSGDVESIRKKAAHSWTGEWCRYFARQLMNAPEPLLPARRWLLRPMAPLKPTAPYVCQQSVPLANWRFHSPASDGNIHCDWTLYGEDFPDLANPEKISLVDWWWGGNLLLGRYPVTVDAGRLKWWRKKCREGTLPPVLVWYIGGLASFVILDGHYRLQAAIEEGIPPMFLVLSELNEREYQSSPEHQTRILRTLEQQQRKNPQYNVEGVNQTLINLYDTRYFYASTHSRAVLGEGQNWQREVKAYLQKHQLTANLDNILNRVSE
ncbi:hypothetical protein [Mixta sp. BE291]|uniref:hypothetical protein n=1 Tax=Mixta sp. BE291 TaxID=3158787 RepID=UPI003325EBF4